MPPPDSELGQWFATHVQPHEPMLRAWLRNRFRSEDDLDDLVQESYLRLLRARERGEVASPKAFLFPSPATSPSTASGTARSCRRNL